MTRNLILKINIEKMATRLSAFTGSTWLIDEVKAFLVDEGFKETNDGWLCDASLSQIVLSDEVLEVRHLISPDEL